MNRLDESIKLSKAKNGWMVTHSFETEFTDRGGRKDTDYHNEDYVFDNLETALEMVVELANNIKE